MATGAIMACQKNNIDLNNMPILGVDATEQGCKAIIDKQMVFTVYQPAAPQGAEAAKATIELAKGGTLDNFDTLSEDKLHLWKSRRNRCTGLHKIKINLIKYDCSYINKDLYQYTGIYFLNTLLCYK